MTNNKQQITNRVQHLSCSGCGAPLTFDSQAGQLKCGYCGHEEAIPEAARAVQEQSYNGHFHCDSTRMAPLSETAVEVKCNGCGANILFPSVQTAGECPFCATPLLTEPTKASPTVIPEGAIPFKIDEKQAKQHIQKWINSRWFAPSALKQLAQQEKLQGVYLPFWTYDAQTVSQYSGQRGEYYYETETYTVTVTDEDGNESEEERTREVRHTRWYSASGWVQRGFDDILISATTAVCQRRLDALEPWGLQNLQPYHPSYLAGFEAQRPQVSLEEGFETAKDIMKPDIYCAVRRDIGGDEQQIHRVETEYNQVTFKLILLPVWLSCYRYRNQQYQVMVNAQTGEVQGERPYSYWKIGGAIIGAIVAIASMVILPEINWNQFRDFRLPQWNKPTVMMPSPPPPTSTMDNIWREAVNSAMRAANLAQTAETQQQWNRVVLQWQEAINLMKAVPASDPNYTTAQQKVIEYQNYLNIAQQRAASF
jgi:ribosomal protein S27E